MSAVYSSCFVGSALVRERCNCATQRSKSSATHTHDTTPRPPSCQVRTKYTEFPDLLVNYGDSTYFKPSQSTSEAILPAVYLKLCLKPPRARGAGVLDHTDAQLLRTDVMNSSLLDTRVGTRFRCHIYALKMRCRVLERDINRCINLAHVLYSTASMTDCHQTCQCLTTRQIVTYISRQDHIPRYATRTCVPYLIPQVGSSLNIHVCISYL